MEPGVGSGMISCTKRDGGGWYGGDVMAVDFFFHSLLRSRYNMNINAGLYFPEICLRRSLVICVNASFHMCVRVCLCIFLCVKGLWGCKLCPVIYNLSFLVGKVREMHFFNEHSLVSKERNVSFTDGATNSNCEYQCLLSTYCSEGGDWERCEWSNTIRWRKMHSEGQRR